jgi:hypothetical protein
MASIMLKMANTAEFIELEKVDEIRWHRSKVPS